MKKIVLIPFLFILSGALTSCNDLVQNSNSSDELRSAFSSLSGGANFKAMVPAIITKCASCHTHEAWYTFNEGDYLAAGLISPSDLAGSKMFYRLSNATSGPGPRNMPQDGGAAFTEEEVTLMENWVNGYGL